MSPIAVDIVPQTGTRPRSRTPLVGALKAVRIIASLAACAFLALASPVLGQEQAATSIFWLEQNPERGPFNPNQRHLHSTAIDTIANTALAGYHGRTQYYGIDVDSQAGKVYTFVLDFGALTGTFSPDVRQSNLDGSDSQIIFTYPVSPGRGILKFEPSERKLYVFGPNRIDRMNPDGSGFENIFSDPSQFILQADIDHVNGALIYLDFISTKYKLLDFDGTNPRVLGATCPQHQCFPAMAVDGVAGRIYYSRYHTPPGQPRLGYVLSQNFDGSDVTVMYGPFSNDSRHSVISMALDAVTDTLYLAHGRDGFGQGLSRAAADGSWIDVNFFNAALHATPIHIAIDSSKPGGVSDNQPPELTVSSPYVLEGDTTGGYDNSGGLVASAAGVSATDAEDDAVPTPVALTNDAPVFLPLGDTVVTWTATDSEALTDEGAQTVTVEDTTAPNITVPFDVTEEATSPSGNVVVFATSAIDIVDAGPTVSCTSNSGDTFPVGTTTVDCVATDASANENPASFDVTIEDTTPPVVESDVPETIVPPDAPISFTATATDNGTASPAVTITSFECWAINGAGKRIDKSESCVVSINGATITILDSGGVGNHIDWTVTATDASGNTSEATFGVVVVNPGRGGGNGRGRR